MPAQTRGSGGGRRMPGTIPAGPAAVSANGGQPTHMGVPYPGDFGSISGSAATIMSCNLPARLSPRSSLAMLTLVRSRAWIALVLLVFLAAITGAACGGGGNAT